LITKKGGGFITNEGGGLISIKGFESIICKTNNVRVRKASRGTSSPISVTALWQAVTWGVPALRVVRACLAKYYIII
jgi:hypothetical protein